MGALFSLMGFFAKWKWIGSDFSCLDRSLDEWKAAHPDKELVLSTRNGHQAQGGNTMSLYYFFRS